MQKIKSKQNKKCVGHKTDRQIFGHVWREHSAYECDRHKTELTDRLTDTDEI